MYGMFLGGFALGFMGAVFLLWIMTYDVSIYDYRDDWVDWDYWEDWDDW